MCLQPNEDPNYYEDPNYNSLNANPRAILIHHTNYQKEYAELAQYIRTQLSMFDQKIRANFIFNLYNDKKVSLSYNKKVSLSYNKLEYNYNQLEYNYNQLEYKYNQLEYKQQSKFLLSNPPKKLLSQQASQSLCKVYKINPKVYIQNFSDQFSYEKKYRIQLLNIRIKQKYQKMEQKAQFSACLSDQIQQSMRLVENRQRERIGLSEQHLSSVQTNDGRVQIFQRSNQNSYSKQSQQSKNNNGSSSSQNQQNNDKDRCQQRKSDQHQLYQNFCQNQCYHYENQKCTTRSSKNYEESLSESSNQVQGKIKQKMNQSQSKQPEQKSSTGTITGSFTKRFNKMKLSSKKDLSKPKFLQKDCQSQDLIKKYLQIKKLAKKQLKKIAKINYNLDLLQKSRGQITNIKKQINDIKSKELKHCKDCKKILKSLHKSLKGLQKIEQWSQNIEKTKIFYNFVFYIIAFNRVDSKCDNWGIAEKDMSDERQDDDQEIQDQNQMDQDEQDQVSNSETQNNDQDDINSSCETQINEHDQINSGFSQ